MVVVVVVSTKKANEVEEEEQTTERKGGLSAEKVQWVGLDDMWGVIGRGVGRSGVEWSLEGRGQQHAGRCGDVGERI